MEEMRQNNQGGHNRGYEKAAPVDTYGGMTPYAGGQTAYDIGKTPMAINTPSYFPQTPRDNDDKYMYGNTDAGPTSGGYQARGDRDNNDYDPNKNYDRRGDYNTRY